jgi:glutamate decarboxylase
LSDQVVQRIVVRSGMNMDLASNLLRDIQTEVDYLDSLDGPLPTPTSNKGYHH